MADRKVTDEMASSILQGMHRVLKYRDFEEKVEVRVAGQKYCWRCRNTPNGVRCGWEPC